MNTRTPKRNLFSAIVLLIGAGYLFITRFSLDQAGCVQGRFTVVCRGTDPFHFYRAMDARLLFACGLAVWAVFCIIAAVRGAMKTKK